MTLYLAKIKYPYTEFYPSLEEFTYRLVESESSKEAKEKTSIAEFTARQILYLTEIGIAWWATEEMWEKGLIFEVK